MDFKWNGAFQMSLSLAPVSEPSKLITFAFFGYKIDHFLTRELRACARASLRYDVRMALARSLDWSNPVNLFSILGF